MSRTVTVTLDDGSKVVYENVPAEVTPDQITARAQSESGKAVRELDGGKPENQIERKAKVGGSAVVRGAAGLPALFGDLASRASQYLPTTPFGVPPNPQEVTAKPMEMPLSQAVQSFGPKPETTPENYLASIGEGVGGSLFGGAGGVARSSFIGGMSGLGSEVGAQVSGDESAFLPRLLGGLAGGGIGTITSGRLGPSPRVQELARESLDGVDPAKVAAARSFMESSGRQGVNIDAAQALEGVGANPSGIRVLRDTLANVKEGDATQALLRAQPSQLQQRGATWLGQVPGNVYAPEQAANNLSEAATGVIQGAKGASQAAWVNAFRQRLEANLQAATKELAEASAGSQVSAEKLGNLRNSIAKLKEQQAALEAAAGRMRDADLAFKPSAPAASPLPELPNVGADSRGKLRSLDKMGEAIIFNQIAKETREGRGLAQVYPPTPPALTLPTLSAEAAVRRQAGRVAELEGQLPFYSEQAAKASAKVEASRAGLREVRAVPVEVVERERRRLEALAASAVPSTAKGKALLQLSKDLKGLTNGEQINEVLKNAVARTKTVDLATPGMDAATAKWVQKQVNELRGNFGESFSPLREANAVFKQQTRDIVDPLKQGQIGGLATKRGYSADTQAPLAKMNALFSAGRDPATSHSPLLETARKLNKQDPQAFRDAAKTYYSGKISNAFEADIGGALPTNKDAADRIYKELFQYQPQYTAMKDSVTAAAESAGVRPAEALRGLDNFAKIVKAARSQPDQLGGMTKQQIIEMAEKHHGANFVRIFGFLPFERMARNLESATMTKTMREMDKLITTPEGLKILAELSRQPVMSRQALALAATAGGVLSQVPETAQSTK